MLIDSALAHIYICCHSRCADMHLADVPGRQLLLPEDISVVPLHLILGSKLAHGLV